MIDVIVDDSGFMEGIQEIEDKLEHLPLDDVGEVMLDDVEEKTPVDTGHLKESNLYTVVGKDQVIVSNNADYAIYVDQGTRFMEAQPFMELDTMAVDEIENLLARHVGGD